MVAPGLKSSPVGNALTEELINDQQEQPASLINKKHTDVRPAKANGAALVNDPNAVAANDAQIANSSDALSGQQRAALPQPTAPDEPTLPRMPVSLNVQDPTEGGQPAKDSGKAAGVAPTKALVSDKPPAAASRRQARMAGTAVSNPDLSIASIAAGFSAPVTINRAPGGTAELPKAPAEPQYAVLSRENPKIGLPTSLPVPQSIAIERLSANSGDQAAPLLAFTSHITVATKATAARNSRSNMLSPAADDLPDQRFMPSLQRPLASSGPNARVERKTAVTSENSHQDHTAAQNAERHAASGSANSKPGSNRSDEGVDSSAPENTPTARIVRGDVTSFNDDAIFKSPSRVNPRQSGRQSSAVSEPLQTGFERPDAVINTPKKIALRMSTPSGEMVDIRIGARSGELDVAVSAADDGTVQKLRQGLSELQSHLNQNGYHADTSTVTHSPGAAEPGASRDQSSHSRSQQQSHSGESQSQREQQQRENPSRGGKWREQLQTSLKGDPTQKGSTNVNFN